jgi:mannose-6-phosphate isomerase-like protein (cupin superfamily)
MFLLTPATVTQSHRDMRFVAFVAVCLIVGVDASRPAAQARQGGAARLTIAVLVTTMDGKPLAEAWVKAAGPVDREGSTDHSGTVTFANVTPGAYRLRFEHENFITLERDVTVVAGRPLKAAVALNAAPPPPPPPKVEPPPPPPVPPAGASGPYTPISVDIPDLFERNFIANAPVKRSPIGCTTSSTSTLIQLREPLVEHAHADADELIYVVAGEGTHKVAGKDQALSGGVFSIVPRGITHGIVRRSRQPLVIISTLSGPPCQTGQ